MNPLALELLLIARLRDQLPAGTPVGSEANFVGTVEFTTATVVVAPPSADAAEVAGDADESAGVLAQTWPVYVALSVTPDKRGLSADFQAAGTLLGDIIAALAGYAPGAPYKPLRLAALPEPQPGASAGTVYFPLHFETQWAFAAEAQ